MLSDERLAFIRSEIERRKLLLHKRLANLADEKARKSAARSRRGKADGSKVGEAGSTPSEAVGKRGSRRVSTRAAQGDASAIAKQGNDSRTPNKREIEQAISIARKAGASDEQLRTLGLIE